ncbi:MAG: hypothetical protein IPK81_08735 [Rhodospirillales bacterium]|nr:MAG: hypothetical protein IPK81_08735 [Rhodospirillales bacterium]
MAAARRLLARWKGRPARRPSRLIHRAGWRAGLLPALLLLAGCSSIGPATIPRDRTDYISSVAESWKQQTLLNIVRVRYGDAPSFLEVSSVVNSYTLQGQVSAGAVFNSDRTASLPERSLSIGAGAAYQDRPTISYTPLAGDKFAKSMLRPIPPSAIFQLVQAGYPAENVLLLTVRSLNGIFNRVTSGGQGRPADPRFYAILDALGRLQASGSASLRIEKRGGEDVGVLVLTPSRSPEVNRDLKFLSDTLNLRPGRNNEFDVVFGATQRNDRELAVLSRSMTEILVELAGGIEVPPEHVARGRTVPAARLSTAEDRRDRPVVRVLSGASPPAGAYSAVSYRGTWYWVDDHDFASKRVFTFLMMFFSLAETGVSSKAPTLTLPVN